MVGHSTTCQVFLKSAVGVGINERGTNKYSSEASAQRKWFCLLLLTLGKFIKKGKICRDGFDENLAFCFVSPQRYPFMINECLLN